MAQLEVETENSRVVYGCLFINPIAPTNLKRADVVNETTIP